MRKSVIFRGFCKSLFGLLWILGITGFAYCGQPADTAAPKARILIGSPIRQKPKILQEFVDSLERQSRVKYSTDYFFVDDNVDEESHQILSQFQQKMGSSCHIELPNQDQIETVYQRDEKTHYWRNDLVWKIAAFKERMIDCARVQGYDYLFLVDSDIVLHPDTIDTLMNAKKEIISNIFWTRWLAWDIVRPQVWLSSIFDCYAASEGETLSPEERGRRWLRYMTQLKEPGVYEVGGLGACTLVAREALLKGVSFKRLKNLSFRGEDRHFCVRAAALGIPLYVDTHLPACHLYFESGLVGVPHYKWACEHHTPLPLIPTPRLTLSMVVRNETNGYLRRVLECARKYINDAVIIDDASSDETVQICKEVLGDIPLHLVQNTDLKCANEVELRRLQWEETVKVNPEWILNLDADEIFEKSFADQVGDLLRDNKVDVYLFRAYDMWDDWFYRDDLYWNAHNEHIPLLVRYKPGIEYRWKDTLQHCGRFPQTAVEFPRQKQSNLRLKHYGWAMLERRRAKAERDARLDLKAKYGCKEKYESILDPCPNLVVWTE
jgi:cellulose synthase/poly-beta-1,6-N-acetylglucosamine synthase-like glycosyltransferase